MRPTSLMVQGTTSDAGKSIVTAGLCRVLARRQVRVAPFKPQNMALNSAVTTDGGEIGRAQALQAIACNIPAHTDFNPVLLKPEGDRIAQVIIQGKVYESMDAAAYHQFKPQALNSVLESFSRLQAEFDCILIEGAGSPAEINLRDGDIANMGFAEAADVPVILVADIDRGGVFATIVGTLELLSPSERARIVGIVINRFRGDISLLKPGLDWLEQRIAKPVLGVLPYLQDFFLDAEDAISQQQRRQESDSTVTVVILVLPRISNHTDFDALRLNPSVNLLFVRPGATIPPCELLIIPGSKNVRADLEHIKTCGTDKAINKHLRYGGKLLGICGGFQMLGELVRDPHGVEGQSGQSTGLALLPFSTVLQQAKQLRRVKGVLIPDQIAVTGYEIHCGTSSGEALGNPFLELGNGDKDGAMSEDGQIIGTYLHGLFDEPAACQWLLGWAGCEVRSSVDINAEREYQLERLANCLEENLDLSALFPDYFGAEKVERA